jgi:hypothetical protein
MNVGMDYPWETVEDSFLLQSCRYPQKMVLHVLEQWEKGRDVKERWIVDYGGANVGQQGVNP